MEIEKLYEEMGGELKEFEKFPVQLDVGAEFEYSKKISEVDVKLFGLVSGDLNPIHFDEEIASKTKFGGRVVHGMLTTSLVSAAVARLPGTIVLLESYFRYVSPVRIGEVVSVRGRVIEKDRRMYRIVVVCSVSDRKVAEGWVKVLVW